MGGRRHMICDSNSFMTGKALLIGLDVNTASVTQLILLSLMVCAASIVRCWTTDAFGSRIELSSVNTARPKVNTHAEPASTAKKISTARPKVNESRPKGYFYESQSQFRRPFNNTTTLKTTFTKQKVNTVGVNSVSVIGQNRETVVKTSAGCNWRTKRHYWHRVSKYNSGSMTRTNVYFRDPQGRLKSAMAWVPKRN
ncbi:hypothetical protein Tco_0002096 [Tanacetum coccineum]